MGWLYTGEMAHNDYTLLPTRCSFLVLASVYICIILLHIFNTSSAKFSSNQAEAGFTLKIKVYNLQLDSISKLYSLPENCTITVFVAASNRVINVYLVTTIVTYSSISHCASMYLHHLSSSMQPIIFYLLLKFAGLGPC